jgi:hypothetical protein
MMQPAHGTSSRKSQIRQYPISGLNQLKCQWSSLRASGCTEGHAAVVERLCMASWPDSS